MLIQVGFDHLYGWIYLTCYREFLCVHFILVIVSCACHISKGSLHCLALLLVERGDLERGNTCVGG